MLAHIQFHARMQRQHNQFSGGVARKRDSAWPVRHADYKRHARKNALESARKRHHAQRDLLILPEHYVMLKEDRVAGPQVNLGGRNNIAFHLASARVKVDLGHVAYAGRFPPAGFAYDIADVERLSASSAGQCGLVVHALAPLALDSFK